MKTQFVFVCLFALAAILLVTVVLAIAKLMRPNKPNEQKNSSYESGEQTEGSSQVAFNIKFYIIAIIFLIFELELVLLFPWAIVFADKQMLATHGMQWFLVNGLEIFSFVFLLGIGLAYLWKKGLIDWVQVPKENLKPKKWPIDIKKYQSVNDKY